MDYYTEDPRISPASLSGFARMALEERPQNQLILEQWFPNRTDATTQWTSDIGVTEDFTQAASHRAFDTAAPFSGRPGRARISGALPPVGERKLLTESEILALQEGRVPQASVDLMFDDVNALQYAVRNRKEIDRSQLLETGKITIADENGLWLEADMGRKANRIAAVGTNWSNVAAPAIADELTAVKVIKDGEGEPPAYALMESAVVDLLRVNAGYLKASRDIREPTELSLDEINEIRARRELPMIIEYSARVRGTNGTVAPVLNPQKIFHVPARPVGATIWGRPVIAGEKEVDIQSNTGGPVVFIAKQKSVPVSYQTVIDAIVLPVMAQPDLTGCLQVLGV